MPRVKLHNKKNRFLQGSPGFLEAAQHFRYRQFSCSGTPQEVVANYYVSTFNFQEQLGLQHSDPQFANFFDNITLDEQTTFLEIARCIGEHESHCILAAEDGTADNHISRIDALVGEFYHYLPEYQTLAVRWYRMTNQPLHDELFANGRIMSFSELDAIVLDRFFVSGELNYDSKLFGCYWISEKTGLAYCMYHKLYSIKPKKGSKEEIHFAHVDSVSGHVNKIVSKFGEGSSLLELSEGWAIPYFTYRFMKENYTFDEKAYLP